MLLALTALFPAHLAAQEQLTRAFELERKGDYAGAAAAYQQVLKEHPADVSGLLGLERALTALNRVQDIIPQVQAALQARPGANAIYSVALRAWSAVGQPDSAAHVVELWSRAQPNDETPYREWAAIALAHGQRQEAERIYAIARQRLGRDNVLAPEMAQVALLERDYPRAVNEWLLAVESLPGYRMAAINSLGTVPGSARPGVLHQLEAARGALATQIEALLQARWGDPMGGYRRLQAGLPLSAPAALELLRSFQREVQVLPGAEARRVRGMTLEAMGERLTGAPAAQVRLEAARAYAESGDAESARRMLAVLARDGAAPPSMAAEAGTTLVEVLIAEGKLDQAQQELSRSSSVLSAAQRQQLDRELALGWARAGKLDQARSTIAGDSTVDGLALAGRLQLFGGDLAGARRLLQAAGPYAGSREEATRRAGLLALLQQVTADTLPELGSAFLALEQGDSARAQHQLADLGHRLLPGAGGAELLFRAGQLAAAGAHPADAEPLLRAAIDSAAPATAPAAQLALAQLMVSLKRPADAVPLLEDLILTYPASAVVPQARRLLDEVRGAVPRT